MKRLLFIFTLTMAVLSGSARSKGPVYDETLNPDVQITEALAKASAGNKFVVAQLGGNWCKWCLRFARFVESDPELSRLVSDNFEFIHVSYNPRSESPAGDEEATRRALTRLGNPTRFGYPVLVVLDPEGNVLHTQDSSFLESGEGYDREKVLRFFRLWTPEAVNSSK